jgi:hypothetical protein
MKNNRDDAHILDCCAYCEATAPEIVAAHAAAGTPILEEDALVYVLVSNTRVRLCPDDREGRDALTEQEQWDILTAPVDLPAGITALTHICPMVIYDGFSTEEATFLLELRAEDGYMVGNCTECGLQVRSAVPSDRAKDT